MNIYISFYQNSLTGKTARKQLHVVDTFVNQEKALSEAILKTEWIFYVVRVREATWYACQLVDKLFIKNMPFEIKDEVLTFSDGETVKVYYL